MRIALFHAALGDTAKARRELHLALDRTAASGSYLLSCQILGILGSSAQDQGHTEEALGYWNRGLALAREHRLAEQSGRLSSFLANHYARLGRLALSRALRRQASELCQEYGGSPHELRFLLDWIEVNARLGCWNVVQRDLARADLLHTQQKKWASPAEGRDTDSRIEFARAGLAAARGRIDDARRMFAESERGFIDADAPHKAGPVLVAWSRMLVDHGDFQGTLELLQRPPPENLSVRSRAALDIEAARAYAGLGRWDECLARLEEFENAGVDDRGTALAEWTNADVLRLRHARATGDRGAIVENVRTACSNLDRRLRSWEAIQESFLNLRGIRSLRDELQDIVVTEPVTAYRLAVAWTAVPGMLGAKHDSARGPSPLQICSRLVTNSLVGSSQPLVTPPPDGAVRLVYQLQSNRLQRWCVDSRGLREDTLPWGERELRDRIQHVLAAAGRPPPQPHDQTVAVQ
jgi:tetratricopeptide (TPR) repeat protein